MSAVLKTAVPRLLPMGQDDIPRVMRIENDIYEFPWTPGNFSDSVRAGYSCSLWMSGDAVAGYAVVMHGAGEAHLLNLSIARACQGRGLGRQLLAALLEAARGHGARNMLLEVRPSNVAGLALYARAGFTRLGLRKGYYPARGGREDALVLGRDL